MPEHVPEHRLVGSIDWYGGENTKTKRENKFGFITLWTDKPIHLNDEITLDSRSSIFVHESELRCKASELTDGRWVTFRLGNEPRGFCALELKLLEFETDLATIAEILSVSRIGLEERLNLSFKLPLSVYSPYLKAIESIINEAEQSSSSFFFYPFPEEWRNLKPQSPIYKILPKQLRVERFERDFPSLNDALEQALKFPTGITRETRYDVLSDQDIELARSWRQIDSSYETAKMLSARGAERLAADFFHELGHSIEDIALHQLSGESTQWETHDLLLDSSTPVDVKNARTPINSQMFVEYTVKRFKKDNTGQDVRIVGVLSPYVKLESMKTTSLQATILGLTSKEMVSRLENEFSKRELTVYFGEPTRWPIWIFNHDLQLFPTRLEGLSRLSEIMSGISEDDWNDCPHRMIPLFLATGIDLPPYYQEHITQWQNWYCNRLIEQAKTQGLTLPWLYLFTFHHFIDAITNSASAEEKGYSPDGYRVIYPSERDYVKQPAGIIDPLGIIDQLISTLETLWDNRDSAELHTLRKYVFRGEGLLRAVSQQGQLKTVLAYCGGFIKEKGKCGYSPLVIGVHRTCQVCNMLVCSKCGFCSQSCDERMEKDTLEHVDQEPKRQPTPYPNIDDEIPF